MSKVAVVYYSGYGHTKVVAENFANEIQADLIAIDQQGNISEQEWNILDQADAIVFGAPTYMASTPWQFKKFADDSSKRWFTRAWQDKIFAGFTNSGSINGDKQMTLIQLQALALQHGGIWVSLGILPRIKSQLRVTISIIWVVLVVQWCKVLQTHRQRKFHKVIWIQFELMHNV